MTTNDIKNASVRLYLQKDEKRDIYVDLYNPLPQHQIDGIRFLYKQFKKKKPGVILNDPSGYGKCVQTVLFLSAIRPLLNYPIFILCEPGEVDNWKEHFHKWTNGFNDIAVQTTDPFSKKMVYINTLKDVHVFCRRNWSVVVVQNISISKEILKLVFNTDFKIWLSTVNMKENLRTFSLIHEWIIPNQKFCIQDFKAKANRPSDFVNKSLLLDAFLEDIVIRRTNFLPPFEKIKSHLTILESPIKQTRKNKDPTGTKVKRSKISNSDNNVPDVSHSNQENVTISNVNDEGITDRDTSDYSTANYLFNFTNGKEQENNNKRNPEMDIEKFIHDLNPISYDGYSNMEESDTTSQQSMKDTQQETQTSSNNFLNAANEIVINENYSVKQQNAFQSINDINSTKLAKESKHDAQNEVEKDITQTASDTLKERKCMVLPQEINQNTSKSVMKEEKCAILPHKIEDTKISDDKTVDVKIDAADEKDTINKTIDMKLLELQEQALKKFKGSIFDRMF